MRTTLLATLLTLAHTAAAAADPRLADLSLEELGDIDVRVASLLPAQWLTAGSSVSSVSAAEWQHRGARRVFDALETQAAVLAYPHAYGHPVLAVRGYARNTSYTGVATSWDGVPLNDLFRSAPQFHLPAINLGALSQVQLIQGPGSALYGSDAFHGLVELRGYESPRDQRLLAAEAGGRGHLAGSLQWSQALEQGARLSLALAVDGEPDQHRHAAYGGMPGAPAQDNERANRYQAGTLSIKLASAAADPLAWWGGLALHGYEAEGFQGLGTRLSGATDEGGASTRFAMAQGGLRATLSPQLSLELKGFGWWSDSVSKSFLKLSTGPALRELGAHQYRGGLQLIVRGVQPDWHSEWALALGGERLGVPRARAHLFTPAGAFLNTTTNLSEGARRQIESLTLEANTHWDERRWHLVYGGRIDHYSDFGSHASPRLGLIHQPRADRSIKLLYGQAFRAPAAVEIHGAQGSVIGNPGLKPELMNSVELVLQQQNRRDTVELTLFRTLWREGIVATLPPGGGLAQYRNIGRHDAKGLSASWQTQLGAWQLQTSASHVRSRNAQTGLDYSAFPRWMLNLGLGRTLGDDSLWLGLEQRWRSHTTDLPAFDGKAPEALPRYARTDLNLRKRWSNAFSSTLQVRNLFDRANRLPSLPGSWGGIPDERLGVSLQFSYAL